MKGKFALKVFGLLTLATVISCDNEVKINDDWEDVTVVYALLDPAADTNWVRIERGYLGNAPAAASFDSPDSLYYENINAYLLEYNSNGNLVGDTIFLERDDSNRQREEGTFTSSGYRIYRTQESINYESTYELNVVKPDPKFTDAKATTAIVEPRKIDKSGLRFIEPNDISGAIRVLRGTVTLNSSENATIYQVYITFKYTEYDLNTKQETEKQITFLHATVSGTAANGSRVTIIRSKNDFLNSLAGQIEADDSKLRFISDRPIEMMAYAGGESLDKYMALNAPSNTLNQNKPEFPGIEQGTGLFSSRTSIEMDNVQFPYRGTTDFWYEFYLNGNLCDRNFAIVETDGDTLICDRGVNGRNEKADYKDVLF